MLEASERYTLHLRSSSAYIKSYNSDQAIEGACRARGLKRLSIGCVSCLGVLGELQTIVKTHQCPSLSNFTVLTQ